MTKEKIIKFIFFIFLFTFLVLLVAYETGYYETTRTKAKTLTEDQIKVFEQDIKQGKEIDITDYVINTKKNYSTSLSNSIYKVSLKLEEGIDKTIKFIFKKANDMVEE